MKFLLVGINAKYIHSNPAIYSLRVYAGAEYSDNIEIAEYTINNRREEILSDIYQRNPDVIGFSCYIWNFTMVKELLPDLPKVLPDAKIWLGGPEVSFDGVELLQKYPMVSGIMTGEGEATFKELLAYYVERKSDKLLLEIKGLLLPTGHTGDRDCLSMDEIPFLYEDAKEEGLSEFENKIIYYESSRGCPFRCSYCLSAIDKSVRMRSLDKVKRELKFFLDNKVPQVKFIDRTFNAVHEHAMSIWRYLIENDNGVTNFHFEIAADIMTQEEIELLSGMRPGLVQLEIGVQSTNEPTLREINRFVNTAHIAKVVKELRKKQNIHMHLDLIAGLPYEDYATFIRSFNEVYGMEPEQLQLGFLKVLKGSLMEAGKERYGLSFQQEPPYEVLSTKWLTYAEVLRLKRVEEMVEIFYNSNQFCHTLPAIEAEFTNAFSMFETLADYYEEKGYFVKAPARSSRYEILLAFACEKNPEREALYRELLTFDYYLREKAKSRPVFAPDAEVYRDAIWDFYCKEEAEPVYLPTYREYHARQTMKMTHMEAFHYPVWEGKNRQVIASEMWERNEKPYFVLFDYQVRNPLTQDARSEVVRK